MADREEKLTREQVIQNRISDFAIKNKKLILLVVTIVVALVLIMVITISAVSSSREKAQIAVAELQDRYNNLDSEADSYADDIYNLIIDAKGWIGGKRYPSVKAQYLVGLTCYQATDYADAYDAFMKAYELNKDIYLAEACLFNAAASAESDGRVDEALALYEQVARDYAEKESALTPRALFNSARIYQQKGNDALAKTTFEQLATSFPASEFGKLAQNILNVL